MPSFTTLPALPTFTHSTAPFTIHPTLYIQPTRLYLQLRCCRCCNTPHLPSLPLPSPATPAPNMPSTPHAHWFTTLWQLYLWFGMADGLYMAFHAFACTCHQFFLVCQFFVTYTCGGLHFTCPHFTCSLRTFICAICRLWFFQPGLVCRHPSPRLVSVPTIPSDWFAEKAMPAAALPVAPPPTQRYPSPSPTPTASACMVMSSAVLVIYTGSDSPCSVLSLTCCWQFCC